MKSGKSQSFDIGFEGSAVENGEIDVAVLAPALLALGDLVKASNRVLNGDRSEARLKITATEKGSFIAQLALEVDVVAGLLDLIAEHPDRMVAADQLLGLLIKGGTVVGGSVASFFMALKFLRGKKPDRTERGAAGTTILIVNDTRLEIDHRVAKLLTDLPTREAAQRFVQRSLEPKGVDSVYLDSSATPEKDLVLTRADLASVQIPEDADEVIKTDPVTREALLKIISAQFDQGYLWRFTDGDKTFTAKLADPEFIARLDRAEVVLSKEDTLRCLLEERQELRGSKLSAETIVLQIKEHISGARQLKLFDETDFKG